MYLVVIDSRCREHLQKKKKKRESKSINTGLWYGERIRVGSESSTLSAK